MKEHYYPYSDYQVKPEMWDKMDEEAKVFYKEFIPQYLKYRGTKKLRKIIKDYIDAHEIKRKDDFSMQLTCMWCEHLIMYKELHKLPFKSEDILSFKIPDFIKNIQ